MKRFFVFLFTIVSIHYSYAQTSPLVISMDMAQFTPMASLQGAIATLMEGTKLETIANGITQGLMYAQSIKDFEHQYMRWIEDTDRYVKQLASFQNITDYSSFMDWYNRSLEYERYLNESIFGANIQIGSRYYSWAELDQLNLTLAPPSSSPSPAHNTSHQYQSQ